MANPGTLLLWVLGIGLVVAAADVLWRMAQSREGKENIRFLRDAGYRDAAEHLSSHTSARNQTGRFG